MQLCACATESRFGVRRGVGLMIIGGWGLRPGIMRGSRGMRAVELEWGGEGVG